MFLKYREMGKELWEMSTQHADDGLWNCVSGTSIIFTNQCTPNFSNQMEKLMN